MSNLNAVAEPRGHSQVNGSKQWSQHHAGYTRPLASSRELVKENCNIIINMAGIVPEEDASVLLEADWNREAGEMVEEVIRTQKEVAELLTNHNTATSELQYMKESCEKELEVLQSDAWRLQLYAELERMRSQLELLAPLAQDTGACTVEDADACAVKRAPDTGPASSGTEAGMGALFQQDENELQELDQEIAAINAELAAAKLEMKEMMMLKAELEREVGSIAQLAVEVEVADPTSTDE